MNDPELQDNSPTGADKEGQTSDNETKAQENPVEEPIVIEDMTNASLEDLVALFQKATQSDSWFEGLIAHRINDPYQHYAKQIG